MEEKDYLLALKTIHANLLVHGDFRPITFKFSNALADYIEKIMSGKTPKEISDEADKMEKVDA